MEKLKCILILLISFFYIGESFCQIATSGYNYNTETTEELRTRDGLPNFFKKLKAGDDVNVGFIGGSVTNGGMWRDKIIDWLKSEYPAANISQINAAIGGKGPDYGACRIKEHLLVHNPDMVFIEFRVNNGGVFQGRAFEGMIPQIWDHNPNIEICNVYAISRWMKNALAEGKQTSHGKYMEEVCNHYGITSIEFGLEVLKLLKEDKLVFQKDDSPDEGKILFSKDGVHPLEAGHDIYNEVLSRSLKAIEDHGTPGPNIIPTALRENNFSNASLIPVSKATFSSNWEQAVLADAAINDDLADRNGNQKPLFGEAMQTIEQGESITIEWEGFLLGITSTTAGEDKLQLEVSNDGNPGKVYALRDSGSPIAEGYTFFDELTTGKHTTTIKIVKLDPEVTFLLGQFLVVGEPKDYQITGFKEEKIDFNTSEVFVYPNPAKDYITISANQNMTYDFFDVCGQNFFSQSIKKGNQRVNISKVPKGIYYVASNNKVLKLIRE